jgi:ketosteroid isomerase-like protein
MALDEAMFAHWLSRYGRAWEARDAGRFAGLFSEDALYYRTPFEAPKKGRAEISDAFSKAVGRQRDIEFGARVLYVEARTGAAHWSCALTRVSSGRRVRIDGVLGAQFDADGRAVSFREWWHADER